MNLARARYVDLELARALDCDARLSPAVAARILL